MPVWICVLALLLPAAADDGYRMWLAYEAGLGSNLPAALPLDSVAVTTAASPSSAAAAAAPTTTSPIMNATVSELLLGLSNMTGRAVTVLQAPRPGGVELRLLSPAAAPGTQAADGFRIYAVPGTAAAVATQAATLSATLRIESHGEAGLLHGAFDLLQRIQRGEGSTLLMLNVTSHPKTVLRMWDLWDNLNGVITRGRSHPLPPTQPLPALATENLLENTDGVI